MKNKSNLVVFGLIAIAVLAVVYALWQKKKAPVNNPTPGNSGGSNTGSNPAPTDLQYNAVVKIANKNTKIYTQTAVNNSLNYLRGIVSKPEELPANLVVDGVWGAKSTAALNYLFSTFLNTANASDKTLSQLKAIIDNSGLQGSVITGLKNNFA